MVLYANKGGTSSALLVEVYPEKLRVGNPKDTLGKNIYFGP